MIAWVAFESLSYLIVKVQAKENFKLFQAIRNSYDFVLFQALPCPCGVFSLHSYTTIYTEKVKLIHISFIYSFLCIK